MATANFLIGSKYRLYRSDGTINANRFDNGFVCLAVDVSMDRTTEFEKITANDCDNPGAPAQELSSPRVLKFEVTFAGTVDAKKIQVLKADWEQQTKREWRMISDETNANGGETETFFGYIAQLKTSKQNAGPVKFECKIEAQGVPTRVSVP